METRNRARETIGFMFAMHAGVYQSVRIPEAPAFVGAGYVWITDDGVGVTSDDMQAFSEMVRNSARADAERFANDWLRVHVPTAR